MSTIEDGWRAESQLGMHGWDFSHLQGRWTNAPLPWNYATLVRAKMRATDQWLDMATGGGELMAAFQHAPKQTAVTESWAPNIALLKAQVVPTGVSLYEDPAEDLAAVPTDGFDLVTNSHGGLPIAGITRVLRPGGWFVTQQVGGANNFALSRFLDPTYTPAYPDNELLSVVAALQGKGFTIQRAETAMSKMTFTDVGAVVYYATVIPWEFPHFDVERALPRLHQLQVILDVTGPITTFEERFIVVAQARTAG